MLGAELRRGPSGSGAKREKALHPSSVQAVKSAPAASLIWPRCRLHAPRRWTFPVTEPLLRSKARRCCCGNSTVLRFQRGHHFHCQSDRRVGAPHLRLCAIHSPRPLPLVAPGHLRALTHTAPKHTNRTEESVDFISVILLYNSLTILT